MPRPCLLPLALLLAGAASCDEPTPVASGHPTTLPNRDPVVQVPAPTPPPLPPSATQGLVLPDRFIALGTEPFWSARVAGDRLTYSNLDDASGRTIAVIRRRKGSVLEIAGTLEGRDLRLEVTRGPCSDGMSDMVYPLSVTRSIAGAVEKGCAKPG